MRLLGRTARLLVIAVIYALVIWYGVITTADLNASPVLVKIAIGLIALGITGSIYRILISVARELKGAIVVLAEFLNRHLLEPQKRRLMNQGRAEAHAEIRERLLDAGIDPDRIIPPTDKNPRKNTEE